MPIVRNVAEHEIFVRLTNNRLSRVVFFRIQIATNIYFVKQLFDCNKKCQLTSWMLYLWIFYQVYLLEKYNLLLVHSTLKFFHPVSFHPIKVHPI